MGAFSKQASALGVRREEMLRELRERLGNSVGMAAAEEAARFSSGATALDRLLPGGGLRHGMLVEWLAEQPSSGAATLGLLAVREACRGGGVMVVLDREQTFYPPAAAGWGVDAARLIVVRPRSLREAIWAAVQSLRSPVVAAVWTRIDQLDGRNFRRLQLAAEAGRTLGVLVRGAAARGQPSWADVRLEVRARQGDWETRRQRESQGHRFSLSPPLLVSLSACRGGRSGGSVLLEIDEAAHDVREITAHHDTHPLPLVAELADPAAHCALGPSLAAGPWCSKRRGRAGVGWRPAAGGRGPGVRVDMPLAEARSLVGPLAVGSHDPAADGAELRRLAAACEQFSPCVALEEGDEPESLLLDISNLTHLLGSEAELAAKVERFFATERYRVQLAVAETVGLAWAMAHYGGFRIADFGLQIECSQSALRDPQSAMAQLPVEALRISLPIPSICCVNWASRPSGSSWRCRGRV